jgi:hypothetical protein
MTPQEQWQSYFDYAGALIAASTPSASPFNIIGRSIGFLVKRLCKFWSDHKATLIPLLSQVAIAAIEGLVANQSNFVNLDPPGPN